MSNPIPETIPLPTPAAAPAFDAAALAAIAPDSPRLGIAILEKWSVDKFAATVEGDKQVALARAENEALKAQYAAIQKFGGATSAVALPMPAQNSEKFGDTPIAALAFFRAEVKKTLKAHKDEKGYDYEKAATEVHENNPGLANALKVQYVAE